MMKSVLFALICLLTACCLALAESPATESAHPVYLLDGWQVQSSAKITGDGAAISKAGYRAEGWLHAKIPATVLAVEMQNGMHEDIFTGMNFRKLPGVNYPVGADFGNLPFPADSPYAVPWWYRKVFTAPVAAKGRHTSLFLDGIIYRANIYLNGAQIADASDIAGAFRRFELDLTGKLKPGRNALAVELFPTQLNDLGNHWVDWNPAPPDKNMGIWHDVYLLTSGPAVVRYPFVSSKVDADLKTAHLTVTTLVNNLSDKEVNGTLRGSIVMGAARVPFSRKITLKPRESKDLSITPDDVPQLNVANPKLWWPVHMGEPVLHTLKIAFDVAGVVSDEKTVKFGIREVTSELTGEGYRVFSVNGKRVLIHGAAWTPDMLLRPSPERQEAELRYMVDLNVNAVRLEGKLEDDRFYELTDRMGLLVMPGWCCCDHWERTGKWGDEEKRVAEESMRSQALRLRSHASVYTWFYGSDRPPIAEVEKTYLRVLEQTHFPNPSVSSATATPTDLTGQTGVKMTGPYEYVPPSYWMIDAKRGGAYGYNTETCPGPAIPPIESVRRMVGNDHLWPIDEVWQFHSGSMTFKNINVFTKALNARYGAADSAEDYTRKAQALAYETHRAMFEAYIRNRYHSTGVIQWLGNNAWPSMIWHLYDYYLRPGGSYFGAKKANEPLHILYSYDDRSIVVSNTYRKPFTGLRASIKVLNLDLSEKYSKEQAVDVAEDGTVKVDTIPEIGGLSTTYYVALQLADSANKVVSRNFYWLSTKPDELDNDRKPMPWQYTPTKSDADMTALAKLPKTTLRAEVKALPGAKEQTVRVTVKNTGSGLSFFTHLALFRDKDNEEVLPALWEDNYFPLLPGEERVIAVKYQKHDAAGSRLKVRVQSWSADEKFVPVSAPAPSAAAAKAVTAPAE